LVFILHKYVQLSDLCLTEAAGHSYVLLLGTVCKFSYLNESVCIAACEPVSSGV